VRKIQGGFFDSHCIAPFQLYGGLNVQNVQFSLPTPIPAKIWGVPFGVDPWCWGLQTEERLGQSSVKSFSKNSNAYHYNPPTSQTDGQKDGRTTRGRVRAGPSFQLGTLSTRIDRRLIFPTRWFSAAAAEHQRVGKTRRRSIYSAERHATQLTPNQPKWQYPVDSWARARGAQLSAGCIVNNYRSMSGFPNALVFCSSNTRHRSIYRPPGAASPTGSGRKPARGENQTSIYL